MHGVADKETGLPESARGDAGVEFALNDSPLLNGLVDRTRLSVRAGHQRHPVRARRGRRRSSATRRVVMYDAVDTAVLDKLTRNNQRTPPTTRISEPQCERGAGATVEPSLETSKRSRSRTE